MTSRPSPPSPATISPAGRSRLVLLVLLCSAGLSWCLTPRADAASRLIPPAERHLDELRQAGLPGDDPVYTTLPSLPITGIDDSSWLSAFGPPSLGNSVLAATVLPDSSLVVGGDFLTANGEPVFHVARWGGFGWEAMGQGLDDAVYTLTAWGDRVVAGGLFVFAGQDSSVFNHIAVWDGTTWEAMGDGFDDSVLAVREIDGTLYAAGYFENSGETEINHVARWDEAGSRWEPLGSGLTGGPTPRVSALGEYDGQLVVGGRFERSADGDARNLATWTGSAWEEFGGGTNERVYTLETFGTTLYAGGLFTQIGGGIPASHVAAWDGTGWSAIDTGMNASVLALAQHDGELYAAGLFTLAGSETAISVAHTQLDSTDTVRWTSASSGMNGGATQLLPWAGDLVATGVFTQAGDADVSYVASLGSDGWGPIGAALDGPVRALQPFGDRLIVGGEFTRAGRDAANIAAWDGARWSTLGNGLNGDVEALGVFQGELYAGGEFALTDSTGAFLARWDEDTETWVDFGGVGNRVYEIYAWGDSLFIGGDFNSAGGVSASKVALFDGEAWYPLGNVINGTVLSLTNYEGDLVAGGDFSGIADLNYVARFDGANWQPFGFGTNDVVRKVGRYRNDGTRGELLIGGDFDEADSTDVDYLALWDDGWVDAGAQIVGPSVETFLSTGVALYLGGECSIPTADGTALRVGRADASYQWSPLGSGLNGRVRDMAIFEDLLYVGGDFTAAGGKSSPYLARWEDLGPVPVQLAHLDGRRENGEVVIRWFVSDSRDHAGFFVYRGDTSESSRLTPELLHAEDGQYEVRDRHDSGGETLYWIEEISTDGISAWFGPIVVGPGGVGSTLDTGISALGPLPFRDTTSFRLQAPVGSEVQVEVFDVLGRRVRSLWNGRTLTEQTDIEWNGRNDRGDSVSSALYFVRVTGPDWQRTLRVLRLE